MARHKAVEMVVEVVKSKIHRARVTEADLHYVGSITIDRVLMEAAGLIPNEKVQVVNVNNGARLETYVIVGEPRSGKICLNGPAARLVQVGDIVIILSYTWMERDLALQHQPTIIFPDEHNRLVL